MVIEHRRTDGRRDEQQASIGLPAANMFGIDRGPYETRIEHTQLVRKFVAGEPQGVCLAPVWMGWGGKGKITTIYMNNIIIKSSVGNY